MSNIEINAEFDGPIHSTEDGLVEIITEETSGQVSTSVAMTREELIESNEPFKKDLIQLYGKKRGVRYFETYIDDMVAISEDQGDISQSPRVRLYLPEELQYPH